MKIHSLLFVFGLLLGLCSCSETENTIEDYSISVFPETLERIPAEGQAFTLTATSNLREKLTVKCPNWVTLEDTEITPEGEVYTFKVDANKNVEKKNGKIQFTARGALKAVEVTQTAAPDYINFTVDKSAISLDDQQVKEIEITVWSDAADKNLDFNVTCEDWITFISKKAFDRASIDEKPGWIYIFRIEQNDDIGTRNGKISFENPNNIRTYKIVSVVQPAEPNDGEIDRNFTPTEQVYKLGIEKAYASYGTRGNTLEPENATVQLVCDGNPNTGFSGPYAKEDAVLYNPEVYNQYFTEFQKWPMSPGTLSKVYPLANGDNYLILTLANNDESIDYMKFYPNSNANGRWGKTDIWISTTADGNDFVKVKNQLDFLYVNTGFVWISLTKKGIIKGAKRVKIAIYDAMGEYIRANEIEFYSARN